MKIHVTVTEDHIRRGLPGGNRCPIALAVRENPRLGYSKIVGFFTIVSLDAGQCYDLPRKARHFISRFDTGKVVKPFEFDLEVPDSDPAQM